MKMGKRILSIFLVVLMLLTAAPLAGFVGLEVAPKAKALDATGQCGDGVYWSFDDTTGELTISGTGAMTDYGVSDSPFCNERGIKSIVINSGVTSIGERSFTSRSSLTSVIIPGSVTSIGYAAFAYCSALKNFTIPNGVESIGDSAFYRCNALTRVEIPNSVTKIDGRAFSDCSKLTAIEVGAGNANYTSEDGILYNKGKTTLIQCPSAKTTVTIPDSVTKIGGYAFENCYALNDVTIPDNVTSTGWAAFWRCSALTNVTIGNSVTSIDNNAFSGCTALTSVTIPDSVTSIGYNAFWGCNALADVYYGGLKSQWSGITIDSHYNDSLWNAVIHCLDGNINGEEQEPVEKYPEGYAFDKDSFSFVNDIEVDISQKYFDGIFEPGTASLAYNEYHEAGGLCYGMAFTTAAIYNGFPEISRWAYRTSLFSSEIATRIRDLKRDTWWGKQSAVYIGEDFNDCLTLLDYIKYAFIYQYSVEAVQRLNNSSNNAMELLSLVKQFTDAGLMRIAIGFSPYKGNNNAIEGHEVLAVGYKENTILIDDPNNSDSVERMTVYDDGSWEYGCYNSHDDFLDWDISIHRPYEILSAGNGVVANVSGTNNRNERYVLNTERLNSDYNLVSVDSSGYIVKNTDYIVIPEILKAGNAAETNHTMLWVKEGPFEINGLENEKNTVICAGDDTVITTTSSAGSSSIIDVNTNEAKIKTEKGKEAMVSFKTVLEEDLQDTETNMQISGISMADEIIAARTDNGITVSGLNDIIITYSEDNDTVAEAIANVTDGREVTIKANEETRTLEIMHDHTYTSVVTTPSSCSEKGVCTFTCSVCGDTYTKPIGKTAHTLTTINQKNANCTEKGYTGDQYCTVCKQTISTGSATNALGHTAPDGNGNCTRCGKHIKDVTPSQPQTNPNACKWCGKVHSGFFQSIVGFFHRILAAIFGAKY